MYTLRERKLNTPLFVDNGVATNKPTDHLIQFETINELAMAMVNGDFEIPSSLSDVVLTTLDFKSLLTRKMIKEPSKHQDLNSELKLVPVFKYSTHLLIREKRPVRLYFNDKNLVPELSADDVDSYFVIRTPKELSEHIEIGNKVVACEDGYAMIYPKICYEIVDYADSEKLFEHIDGIDLDKFSYYIAKGFGKNF